MNIFLLDWDIQQCAEWHCDKHIVKMPLETTQMLSTVHWRYTNDGPYLPVHAKHPCTLWAGETRDNYFWLWKLGIALCEEYTYRYSRVHACENVLYGIKYPPIPLQTRGFSKFPQAMPDEYKNEDPIMAYRQYYINDKARICRWKNRPIPPFMMGAMFSHLNDEASPSLEKSSIM
jgi:hypothetical protein